MPHQELSLLLAGDALITRPWAHVGDADFLGLVDEIRTADVAITNLETVIHEFKGYAQADSGGSYLASPPQIAKELKWAGFDMLVHANNHSFDYGPSGVLETIEHVARAGLILAGSGEDLQQARAPRYCHCDAGTVGLVAMASDFIPYGKASHARPDMRGRPGVNPLGLIDERAIFVPETTANRLKALVRSVGGRPKRRGVPFRLGWFTVHPSVHFGASLRPWVAPADLDANLNAIGEAAANADIVVASVHAHRQGPWLQVFARQAIERGAHVVFVHGPHHVLGIELWRDRPIFYSMGDFAFEVDHVARFPAEEYERVGLAPDAAFSDLQKVFAGNKKLLRKRRAYEGFVASIAFDRGRATRIRLIPVDLQFNADRDRRGRPQLASPELGAEIMQTIAARSRQYRTEISYDAKANHGEVVV
jgi:poly-gamma-glutamate capsule biosynthesis protein CapA/YwtB (metallophosphatase superfamily)